MLGCGDVGWASCVYRLYGLAHVATKPRVGMVQCVPTMVLAGVFGAGTMCCALAAEHIKKKNDLVTYQEISDFLDGKKADSEETRTGWAYEHPQLANAIKFAAAALIGLIVFELVNAAMSHF